MATRDVADPLTLRDLELYCYKLSVGCLKCRRALNLQLIGDAYTPALRKSMARHIMRPISEVFAEGRFKCAECKGPATRLSISRPLKSHRGWVTFVEYPEKTQ